MNASRSIIVQGVGYAALATLAWASNFISPYVLQGYGIQDFMLVRFLLAGLLGLILLPFYRAQLRHLHARQWLSGMGLGVMGYLAYSSCIAGGVIYGGPLLIAAFIGAVPVLQALLGNVRRPALRWGQLALPIGALCVGLMLVNLHVLQAPAGGTSLSMGVAFAVGAVLLWLSFSVVNQTAMEPLHVDATGAWTCLMLIGAGLCALILTPLAWAADLLRLPSQGLATPAALHLYGWALLIALLSSVIGAWAWNLASRRLPMVLSGQLIALESFFASVLGLAFEGRLPSMTEALGLAMILFGTVCAVRVILAPTQPCLQRSTSL
ncbi:MULTISPECIES: EamA family transporter [unclassified Pseudomonas]|uniref:DMT family transporter n=1 Tax=unclassified Pseudomonas TaxID=196821 RepID=UPI000D33A8D8|nr:MULTISPECIES: EamA family transporter [unclassified Pseudomonas]RAU45073.1 EamA/RhaT family transporter [Pseudomonas sp. RIT 409]RAU51477.1 EamA/RhaT family transporter [Pseudomonas sp. RIT 412]